MSFVEDQVQRIDAQLDRLLLSSLAASTASLAPQAADHEDTPALRRAPTDRLHDGRHSKELRAVVKVLSSSSSSRSLLPAGVLVSLLEQTQKATQTHDKGDRAASSSAYEEQLQWLVVAKAAAQTHGLILRTLLDQILPLSNEIWYWDAVLGSNASLALYSAQTAPWHLWSWSRDIYREAWRRFEAVQNPSQRQGSSAGGGADDPASASLSESWRKFYQLVKASIRDRSLTAFRAESLSPFPISQAEARRKQLGLRKLREMSASGLGVLMDEGLKFELAEDLSSAGSGPEPLGGGAAVNDEWRPVVAKSVALMESVLRHITVLETGVATFEDTVFASVDDEVGSGVSTVDAEHPDRPTYVLYRLLAILEAHLPHHKATSQGFVHEYGRPSRLVRYWLPATVLVLSSSTALRILVHRQAAIETWIRELGTTLLDFWTHWVVGPTMKVIATIRHDEEGEIAIMSKRSLEGDRSSLERMVVDFAMDNPQSIGRASLTEGDLAEVRQKVKEGDLTPVLKAYEKDLRRPFMGTVRGDLVRALLIQIQKTKVDVEVAMGGIDALLKSQELVFGFVGLTPGVLVCWSLARWLSHVVQNRGHVTREKKDGRMIRLLRNIDRILLASKSAANGMLSYKDHGLLLCEVHILRQRARRLFPAEIYREFLEEVQDLVDMRTGIERQTRVVERMRWAYGRWMT